MLRQLRNFARSHPRVSSVLTRLQSRFARIRLPLGRICLSLAVAVLLAELAAPDATGLIDPHAVRSDGGAAFTAPIRTRIARIYSIHGYSGGQRESGQMILSEDGFPLGPDRTVHELIRSAGSGAYSHWENTLFFSSSDGSDPRTNGRVYSYRVGSTLRPALKGFGILAALIGLWCIFISTQAVARPQSAARADQARPAHRIRRLGLALSALGVIATATLIAGTFLLSPQKVSVNAETIRQVGKFAYYAPLSTDHRWPWRGARISAALNGRYLPHLVENGIPVGRPSLSLGSVLKGDGQFAYFGDAIAFSTPDFSDPRTNARRYEVEFPIEPAPFSWSFVIGVIGVGAIMIARGRRGEVSNGPVLCGPVGHRDGVHRITRPLIEYSVMTLGALGGIAALFQDWWSGSTSLLSVGSYFPVSDALGYYQCALSIGASDSMAQLIGDWCSRRALYPAMLSSLLALSGWSPGTTLILLAGMIGLGTGTFLLAVQRTLGWMTALLATAGVVVFAQEFALATFMTESLGLVAGLCGLSLLLLSVRRTEPTPALLTCGLGMISIGMAVRVGAVFALPILGVWTIYATRTLPRPARWRLLVVAAGALALGFLLHLFVVYSYGGIARNTAGNSAVVLYGLSTGSRDWSQAHRDFADDFRSESETVVYEKIRGIALSNIRERPRVFIASLMAAAGSFATQLFTFGGLEKHNGLVGVAFVFGLVACLVYRRNGACSLLLAFALAEFLSAPFAFDAGGHRGFAVTVAARLATAALGITFALSAISPFRRGFAGSAPEGDGPVRLAANMLAGLLAFLAVFSSTSLAETFRLKPIEKAGVCANEEQEVVAQLRREAIQMTLGEYRLPLGGEPLGVPYERLQLDPASPNTWWLQLKPQPSGTTLMYAVQRAEPYLGKLVTAFADAPVADGAAVVSLCVAQAGDTVKLGDSTFYRVVRSHARKDR